MFLLKKAGLGSGKWMQVRFDIVVWVSGFRGVIMVGRETLMKGQSVFHAVYHNESSNNWI